MYVMGVDWMYVASNECGLQAMNLDADALALSCTLTLKFVGLLRRSVTKKRSLIIPLKHNSE